MRSDDVNLKGIALFLGLLAATLVAVYFSLGAMWRGLEKKAAQADAVTLRAEPVVPQRPYFPAPREQPAPQVDLETFRAQEEAELNSYGWVDKKAGVVRIPIDRAIELLTPAPKGPP